MNFEQCRAYLDSLQVIGIKLGLDSVRTLLNGLNNPHLRYPTLLVAGTNGKGSVCAMLTRILSRHGLRAGLYTSPHLVAVQERIRVNHRMISRPAFCRALTEVRQAADKLLRDGKLPSPPTHFEVLTCAALSYFKTGRVDIAVLEVGLGGRFDATNVVTPILSVITSIGRDHEKYLGRTIDQIALEKAGIIKPKVPVVSGALRPAAGTVIRKRARELRAPYLGALDPPHTLKAVRSRTGYRFVYDLSGEKYSFSPGLAGLHQGRNGGGRRCPAWPGMASAPKSLDCSGDRGNSLAGPTGDRWPFAPRHFGRRPQPGRCEGRERLYERLHPAAGHPRFWGHEG
jgi:dihydrofolate synthase/folylpolyglutamate synthase